MQYNASKAALNSLGRFVLPLFLPFFPPSPLSSSHKPSLPTYSTLANEEKDITTVSIRPGTPDTQMQTKIRELGPLFLPHSLLSSSSCAFTHPLFTRRRSPHAS